MSTTDAGCSLERKYDGGDHMILLGAVEDALVDDNSPEPVVWYGRNFQRPAR